MSEFKDKFEKIKHSMNEAISPQSEEILGEGGFNFVENDDVSDLGFTISDTGSTLSQDIEPEFSEEYPQAEEENIVKKKKRVSRKNQQINEALMKANLLAEENMHLLNKLQYQDSLLAQKDAILDQQEMHTSGYYENAIAMQENALKQRLKDAKENMDVDEEIELEAALYRLQADRALHEYNQVNESKNRYRTPRQGNYNDYTYHNQTYQPQPYYPNVGNTFDVFSQNQHEEAQNNYLDWLDENPWADDRNSRHYDPVLREESELIAAELNKRMRFNGDGEFIDSPEYYQTITNYMSEKYGLGASQPQSRRNYENYDSVPVAPTGGMTMAENYQKQGGRNSSGKVPWTEKDNAMISGIMALRQDVPKEKMLEVYRKSKIQSVGTPYNQSIKFRGL